MAAGTIISAEHGRGKARAARTQEIFGAGRRNWAGTPEIYFPKTIDNSRLVKVADPRRTREMRQFSLVLVALFALVMVYAWQHFSAVEYGYRIETLKSERDSLAEMNRALRLEQASLRDPERIDALARGMGLQTPDVGQVVRMEGADDAGGPVLAQAGVVVVVPR
ncbi:MAG: cell division protein FtsL [Candidatus Korobacteraceae bacterium]